MDKFLEQFVKFPMQQKAIGLAVAVLAIFGITWMSWITEYQETMEDNQSQLDIQAAKLLKLQTQAQNRDRYMREIERLKSRLREAEEQLPKSSEIPKLLRDITYEAGQSGLDVKKFQVAPEKMQGEFAAVPIKMVVDGSYHEVAVFFDRLAKMPRIVNVTDLNMGGPRLQNKKIVLSSSFTATTYRFVEKKDKKKKKK